MKPFGSEPDPGAASVFAPAQDSGRPSAPPPGSPPGPPPVPPWGQGPDASVAAPPAKAPRRPAAVLAAAGVVAAAAVVGAALLGQRWFESALSLAGRGATGSASAAPSAPASAGGGSAASHGTLRGLLLPVTHGWALGEDSEGLGNDVELTVVQERARMNGLFKDVPSRQRATVRRIIDQLRVQGTALRTYRDVPDGRMSVTISLDRFGGSSAERLVRFSALTAPALHERRGPAVPGHRQAYCVVSPKPAKELAAMHCFGAEGGIYASLRVTGVSPLDTRGIAAMFGRQLGRLGGSGAAI